MPRYTVAGRSTVTPTNLRAAASLFSTASQTPILREVGIFNTTNTACAVGLTEFTNATGVGAALTKVRDDPNNQATSACSANAGHTADGTVGGVFRQATLGAAAGAGVIWTFGDRGKSVALGTANGVGITCPTGTGQVVDYYVVWDE